MRGKITLTLLLTAFAVTSNSCNYKSKKNFHMAFPLRTNGKLYVEFYHVGLMNNITSSYLTDSVSFRKYLGTFDAESEIISVQADGDRILVEKSSNGREAESALSSPETKVYSLENLKKSEVFD